MVFSVNKSQRQGRIHGGWLGTGRFFNSKRRVLLHYGCHFLQFNCLFYTHKPVCYGPFQSLFKSASRVPFPRKFFDFWAQRGVVGAWVLFCSWTEKIAPRMHQNSPFQLKSRKIFWVGAQRLPGQGDTSTYTPPLGASILAPSVLGLGAYGASAPAWRSTFIPPPEM